MDAEEEARAILRQYANATKPADAQKDAAWAAIATTTGVGTAAPGALAAAGGARFGLVAKLGLAVTLLALLGAGGWWLTTVPDQSARDAVVLHDPQAPDPPPSQPAALSGHEPAAVLPTAPQPILPAISPPVPEAQIVDATEGRAHRRAVTAPQLPAPALEAGTLAQELALLGEAQRALTAGDARGALRALAQHASRFPQGALANEREVARVGALCAAGRDVEARAAADRLTTGAVVPGPVARALSRCASRTNAP